MYRLIKIIALLLIICLPTTQAGIINVSSIADLVTAISAAKPGDDIVLADGTYTTSSDIVITKQGTATLPIRISAKTIGGVILAGSGGFVLDSPAKYIIIKGFKFTIANGRTKISSGATFCTFTRNVFDNPVTGSGSKPYLSVSGDDCEISYNTFQNKASEGQMISVQGPGSSGMAQRTWIHHNYFYNFLPSSNNCAAIQIGLSGRSMSAAHCLVEYNLFSKTVGENEGAVCHKACENVLRYNTILEGTEELSLRHGNKSEVYGNFFFGSTGLRFSGDDHKIYSNQFVNCSNGIVCTNGDGEVAEGSLLTCHDRADRVQVVNNTMINSGTNFLMPSRTGGLGASNIVFANNIIQGGDAVSIRTPGPYANPVWEGNLIFNTTAGSMPSGSYIIADPKLVPDENRVYHLQAGSPAIGSGVSNYSYVTMDIDGQPRMNTLDKGADQFTQIPATNRPLKISDVGPNAIAGTPVEPTGLTATLVSPSRIDLTWTDASSNEDFFNIEVSYDGNIWTMLKRVPAGTTSFVHEGLATDKKFYYRVEASNIYGFSEPSNLASMVTTGLPGVPSYNSRENLLGYNLNKSSNELLINYVLPDLTYVNLEILGLNGNKVATLVNQVQPQGSHQAKWNTFERRNSLYLVRLITQKGSEAMKILI
ncbi:MAG TPA: chondroitinase-B domain-containing protein [Bacteroidales bacterium]|nr:chondroitinase-B domain-containing protein [Bacteroidales bacterium]